MYALDGRQRQRKRDLDTRRNAGCSLEFRISRVSPHAGIPSTCSGARSKSCRGVSRPPFRAERMALRDFLNLLQQQDGSRRDWRLGHMRLSVPYKGCKVPATAARKAVPARFGHGAALGRPLRLPGAPERALHALPRRERPAHLLALRPRGPAGPCLGGQPLPAALGQQALQAL